MEPAIQMGENFLAHRRGSTNSDGGKVAFKAGLAMTSVTSFVEPNILGVVASPVMEKELEAETETGPDPHPVPGENGRFRL
jgi:hypothetical protein